MYSRKKIAWQIILYVIICFGLMYITGAFYLKEDGYLVRNNLQNAVRVLNLLGLFSPLIACFILRYASGEGFKDGIMLPKFNGHFRWYFAAVCVPLLMGLIGCVLITIILHEGFTFKNDYGLAVNMLNPALSLDIVYYSMFVLLGEELGWRAYLYDKLEELFRHKESKAAKTGEDIVEDKSNDAFCLDKRAVSRSVIIGGIVWGLWHAQLVVVAGLNFGKDYAGFPYVGIVLMCISCIFMGAFLQLLRKRTDSVIAPTLAHAVLDSSTSVILVMFLSDKAIAENAFLLGICGLVIPSIIVGAVSWYLLLRESGK
ncbi:MAG: CPBP family intramembrane metalloprotease [Lachnospiraceae bacterium]|nr:CPBP family intramembrane metalloprotease [Lachnospiraceae bacterium]